jgi:arylsulfatase A-like enzyme
MLSMSTSTRPNIILLTTDQQRGDCMSIDENAPACLETPHLDMLAHQGTRFRRGYSECPSCFPARRTLMSGMAPAAQGMVGMSGSDWSPPHTLAGELGKAGYHTYLIGKLHLQPKGKRFGFDHQVLTDAPMDYYSEYHRWLRSRHGFSEHDVTRAHGMDPNGWDARASHLREDQKMTYWCMSEAVEFIEFRRDPSVPFFLNISIFDPHPPITPPEFYYNRYINRDIPEPVQGEWAKDNDPGFEHGHHTSAWRIRLSKEQMRCTRAGYYATVNYVDDQVGRLVTYLTRSGLYQNTCILFTSDHGEMLGDHHLFRKCWPYEGSARVPFFIKPARSMACDSSIVSDRPVGLQDVMPTLLDIAGAPIPESCTGRSLLPILKGEQAPIRDMLHGEHAGQYDYNDGMHYLVGDR